jgi:hypothetical protein
MVRETTAVPMGRETVQKSEAAGIELGILGRQICSIVAIPTELPQLKINAMQNTNGNSKLQTRPLVREDATK